MDGTTSIHDFFRVLNDTLDERFPKTERFQLRGGDFFQDALFELREGGKTLQYSPYEMYSKSEDYETTIEAFISMWERELRR